MVFELKVTEIVYVLNNRPHNLLIQFIIYFSQIKFCDSKKHIVKITQSFKMHKNKALRTKDNCKFILYFIFCIIPLEKLYN